MVPPRKGDYLGIPISVAGKKVADQWDLARDEASNDRCASYGPPTIMNQPTRLHISWQDDSTLRIDTDYGTQTRVFSFGQPPIQRKRTRQGTSVAVWEARRGRGAMTARYLTVTTANMLPGYLRKNGVPYGEQATLTEYFDIFSEPQGAMIMVVTAVLTDPVYLEHPYIVASQFKKEADSSKWDPTPCSARW
jgi:hypothetical protein